MIWETYDIYKDERSPKSVDNQCFNSFKIYICPNNAFFKYEKWNLCNVGTHDPQIAILSFNWLSCSEVYQILYKWKLLIRSLYHCLFWKEIHYAIEVCHSPLSLFQMFVGFHTSRICLHSPTRLRICFASVWNDKA